VGSVVEIGMGFGLALKVFERTGSLCCLCTSLSQSALPLSSQQNFQTQNLKNKKRAEFANVFIHIFLYENIYHVI
jgi:hypothetical protein